MTDSSPPLVCARCGGPLSTGFELVMVAFPRDLDDVERIVRGAEESACCRRCLTPNRHLERIYLVAFTSAQLALVRTPTNATEGEAEELLGGLAEQLTKRFSDEWSVHAERDVTQFRTTVANLVLAQVRGEGFAEIRSGVRGPGPAPLSPAGTRDRDYHAALALMRRPGFLVFTALSNGRSEVEARASLEEACRFQLANSFFLHLAGHPLAGFDPVATVEEHFVPACFEDERVLETIALVAEHDPHGCDPVVIDAALGAAAGQRRAPRRRELAEGLVAALRRGVQVHDDPEMWHRLVDAEDILRALIAGRARIEGEDDVVEAGDTRELVSVAAALGHGEEVGRRYWERRRVLGPLGDPAVAVDVSLAVAAEHNLSDGATGQALNQLVTSAALEDAAAVVPVIVDQLGATRPAVAVPSVCTLARRLTRGGEPRRALEVLGRADRDLEWHPTDDHSACVGG